MGCQYIKPELKGINEKIASFLFVNPGWLILKTDKTPIPITIELNIVLTIET